MIRRAPVCVTPISHSQSFKEELSISIVIVHNARAEDPTPIPHFKPRSRGGLLNPSKASARHQFGRSGGGETLEGCLRIFVDTRPLKTYIVCMHAGPSLRAGTAALRWDEYHFPTEIWTLPSIVFGGLSACDNHRGWIRDHEHLFSLALCTL